MPESDLALLTRAAHGAAKIATAFWSGGNRVWDKGKNDPVSEADIAVDDYLRDTLVSARPDYGWLSEETPDTSDRRDRARIFVVDPIDGTRSFVAGDRTWAHSLAVVEDGRPIAAVVMLPLRDKLYAAQAGGGATLNDAALAPTDWADDRRMKVLANAATMEARHWPGTPPEIDRSFRPSLAYRLCLVAEGRYDAMVTFRDSWEWDIAAGALIAAETGAQVTDRRGVSLTFNSAGATTPGVVVARPAAFDRIGAHLRLP